jgi:hypothetical protein
MARLARPNSSPRPPDVPSTSTSARSVFCGSMALHRPCARGMRGLRSAQGRSAPSAQALHNLSFGYGYLTSAVHLSSSVPMFFGTTIRHYYAPFAIRLRAAEAALPQVEPHHLDQRKFLWESYVGGQDIDEVWRPTDLVSGYKRGPECRNILYGTYVE